MYSVRCLCGKIVCQVDNMPYLPKVQDESQPTNTPGIVILCRHCRRYVVLRVPTLTEISFKSGIAPSKSCHTFTPNMSEIP